VEDRISGLKDKIEIKERTEENIDKRLKIWERNIQELCNSIKRQNLRIMGIKGEEVWTKSIRNILLILIYTYIRKIFFFNIRKIIEENFPNAEKEIPI
jgi:chromosome segregation ATPase